uniref:Uncharacterized protein n=1 Tax=Arion vulgaris TaxID=1028688 RepID=A0A0B7B021_9EUPU
MRMEKLIAERLRVEHIKTHQSTRWQQISLESHETIAEDISLHRLFLLAIFIINL